MSTELTESKPRAWQRWTFASLALTHILVSFHEIAAPYFAGHHGWNAALRSLIGRNYVKYGFFDTGFAPYKHFGWPESLANAPIHWHHPPTVNLFVGASFSVFGEHEWAARLVAVIPAILVFFLLHALVRRRWGSNVALIAAATLVFVPMQVEWGKMLNYEVQIVAAALAGLYAAERYRDSEGRARWYWGAACCAALCLAGSFDWPGFILAAFVGFDSLIRDGWRRPWLFVAIGASTTLTLGLWLWWLEGFAGDGGLLELAQWRSGGKVSFGALVGRQGERLLDYYGPFVLLMAVAGIAWTAIKDRCLDPVVTTFLLGNLLYVAVFKQAAYVHLFYLYFSLPAIAVAFALGARGVAKTIPDRRALMAVAVIGALAFAGTVLPRIPITHARSYKILPPKHPAKGFPWDGELHRAVVGQLIHEQTERGDRVVFHPGAKASLQMRYYADRDYRLSRSLMPPRARLWVVPDRLLKPRLAQRLASKHRVTRIAHLAIVDLGATGESQTLVIKAQPQTLAHWYLVSSIVPPWSVEPAPELHERWVKRMRIKR